MPDVAIRLLDTSVRKCCMLNIQTMPLGAYQTNCYILWGEGSDSCVVIDPGFEPEAVLQQAKKLGKTITDIFLTHGHFDHVGAVMTIAEQTDCRVWLHEGDYSQSRNPQNAFFYPLANCAFPQIQLWEEGQTVCAAGLEFRILSTPGHTWGSVCILCQDHIFSGDTLFQDSCGRTDLPGGSFPQIRQSLLRLKELEGDYAVHPGHGPDTTLAEERKFNPYMQ